MQFEVAIQIMPLAVRWQYNCTFGGEVAIEIVPLAMRWLCNLRWLYKLYHWL